MTEVVLSVILPNYNHLALLPRALDALLAQELPADEIIIVDDGSSDDSLATIERYASKHSSIRPLFHQQNRGVLTALSTGISAAHGRILYLAAADDKVLPGFFRDGLALLERFPEAGLFAGEAEIVDGKTGIQTGFRPTVRPLTRAGFLNRQDVAQLFRRADFVLLTGSALIRRDLVVEHGGLDAEAGPLADSLLTRKIVFAHGFCYLPRPVAAWHTFTDSYSFSTALCADKAEKLIKEVPAKIAADPIFPRWYAPLFARRLRFAYAKLIGAHRPLDRKALIAVAGATAPDRFVLSALAPLASSRQGYNVLLAWLTFRFRPYRLRDVVMTALARRSETRDQ